MPAYRRVALGLVVTLLLAAALATGSWALVRDDGPRSVTTQMVAATSTTATTLPPTTTATTTAPTVPVTTRPPAALPTPAPVPTDEYAPTPVIVHGTLALPTISVRQQLHEGVTLTAIDRGPSHWPGTAMPGQVGNVVVAGHRVTHTEPFLDIDRLRPGDPLVFTLNDGSRWTYAHTGTEIVAPDALHIVDQTPEPIATLFACHPKGSAAQRIVARFRLVGGPE